MPSIDEPKFVSAPDAAHLEDDSVVLALSWQGE
ncbi:MAG: hypothetical protein GY949_19735, partial [Gammaproteobacteria bacterium]|nr:hypothetical protein [Gammaproteobacteria bacterium]